MSATQSFGAHFLPVFAGYLVRLLQIFIMIAVFRSLPANRAMRVSSLLSYAVLSSALGEQLRVSTPMVDTIWDGSFLSRMTRPLSVLGGFAAETAGRWLPSLLLYSAPVCLAAALLGVPMAPRRLSLLPVFAASLLLGVSLGFAMDFLFSMLALRMRNACWAVVSIRGALTALLSGAAIPFALLPPAAANVLSLLPFASLAGAPLSIYVGAGDPLPLLALSAGWNVLLWPACIVLFRRSGERLISFGG